VGASLNPISHGAMSDASTKNGSHSPAETLVAAGMFVLSLMFLVLVAGLLYSQHAHSPDHTGSDGTSEEVTLAKWDAIEHRIQLYGLAIIWPIFIAEAVWSVVTYRGAVRRSKAIGWVLLITLAPPLRIAGRISDRDIWLPRLGWRPIDRDLRKTLERFFGVPMIVIALMVLPLLAIEFGWRAHIASHPGLGLFLEISNSLIWMAFAVEFLVMISVADKKLRYCALHWVDLAIILLPVMFVIIYKVLPLLEDVPQIAPLLRSMRILQLSQLSRMGRVYRMQGLALKAWRAFLVLEIIQRVIGRPLEKQLQQLEELLLAKEEEVKELRQEIANLKKRITETVNVAAENSNNATEEAKLEAASLGDKSSRN
jgi:voltage-gated potassium channel